MNLEVHVFINDLSDIVRRFADRFELGGQRAVEGGDIRTVHDQVGAGFDPFDFMVREIVMDAHTNIVRARCP